jgi:hypothetical protein
MSAGFAWYAKATATPFAFSGWRPSSLHTSASRAYMSGISTAPAKTERPVGAPTSPRFSDSSWADICWRCSGGISLWVSPPPARGFGAGVSGRSAIAPAGTAGSAAPPPPDPGFPDPGFPDPGFPDPGFPDPGFPDPEFPDPEFPDPELPDAVGFGSGAVGPDGLRAITHSTAAMGTWNDG